MTPEQDRLLLDTRRQFFERCGISLGQIALASLLSDGKLLGARDRSRESDGGRGRRIFRPRSRTSSICSWRAAPSQFELFDHKPKLQRIRRQVDPGPIHQGQALRIHGHVCEEPPKLLGIAPQVQTIRQVRHVDFSSACRTSRTVADELTMIHGMSDRKSSITPRRNSS